TTFSGLSSGTYNYIVRDSKGCTYNGSATLTSPDPIAADAVVIQSYTCLQSASIQVQNVTGGTPGYTYSIDGVTFVTGDTFTGLSTGNYTITVKDASGCTFATIPVTIPALDSPTDITFNATAPYCTAETSVVNLSVTGGSGTITYEIIDPVGAIASNTTGVFNNLAPNTYTFKVTDSNACSYEENFTIIPVQKINVSGTLVENVSCQGGLDGVIQYSITGISGTYSYTVTGPTPITPQNGITTSPLNFSGLVAGNYTITVTDDTTNCTDTATVTINEPLDLLMIDAVVVTDPSCSVSGTVPGTVIISISGGWGGYTYQITDPSGAVFSNTTGVFKDLLDTSAPYSVDVADVNGCSVSSTFTLNPAIAPELALNANNLCYDASVGVTITASVTSGGQAPFQYRINSGAYQSNTIFSGLTPGTYTVDVIDNKNCTDTETITINPRLTVNASLDKDLDCSISPNAEINISIANGNPVYSYEVFLDGTIFQASTAVSVSPFVFNTSTAGSYQFVISDASGCTVTSNNIRVTSNVPPTVSPVVTDPRCAGSADGSVNLNVTGGAIPYQVVFNGSAPSTQMVYTGLIAGTFTYSITDAKGCETTGTVNLTDPAVLALSTAVSQDYTCTTGSATIDVTSITGGSGSYTYSIDGVNFGVGTTFSGLTAGTYTITAKDSNNCTVISTQTIDPLNGPTDLSFTPTAITCPAVTSDITVNVTDGNGPFNYKIIAPVLHAKDNGNNPTFPGLAAGTYTFEVTDAKGCAIQESYTVNTIPKVNVLYQLVNNVTCKGDLDGEFTFETSDFVSTFSYVVEDSAGNIVQSANNINAITPISVPNLEADTYVVIVTDDITNCTASAPALIAEPTTPLDFTFTNTDVTCSSNASILVNATGGWGSYKQQLMDATATGVIVPFQSNKTFTNITAGTYTIRVMDANGCIVDKPITINAIDTPTLALDPSSDVCSDANGAEIVLTATGGQGPYRYRVNGGTFQVSETFSNLAPGTYNFEATDIFGCSTGLLTIVVPERLQISNAVVTKDLTCSIPTDAVIQVTVNGGYLPYNRYEVSTDGGTTFNPGAAITGTSFSFNTNAAGNYIFRVYDDKGCYVISNPIQVDPITTPEATHIATDPSCYGGDDGVLEIVPVSGSGLSPYQFSFKGGSFTSQRTYSGLSAGTAYTYTIKDSKGCETTYSVVLNDPPIFDANVIANNVSCGPSGDVLGSIDISITSGGVADYTYTLFDQSNNIVTVSGPTPNPATTSDTSITFDGLNFGDYYVRIINANGCEYYENPVRVLASPYISLTSDPAIVDCISGGTVELTADSGSGNYTFTILGTSIGPNSVTTSGNPVLATFTGLNPGQKYVFQAIDDVTGCSSYIEAEIPNPSNIDVVDFPTVTDVNCFGETDGSLEFQIEGFDSGVTVLNYEIRNALTNSPLGAAYSGSVTQPAGGPTATPSITVNNIPPGDYVLFFQEDTTPFCSNTYEFRILEPNPVELSLVSQSKANCTDGSFVTVRATGGSGSYTYAYVLAGAAAPTTFPESSTMQITSATYPVDYDIYVQDINGCIAPPVKVTLEKDPETVINLSVVDSCVASDGTYEIEVELNTAGIAPHYMSVNGGTFVPVTLNNSGDTVTISNLSFGDHTVRVIDSNGCGEAAKTITISPPFSAIATQTAEEQCDPVNSAEVTLVTDGGSGDFNFIQTSPAGPTQINNPVFTGLTSGTYNFDIVDNVTGCVDNVSIDIEAPVNPTFTLSSEEVSCFGGNDGTITVTLNAGNLDVPYLYSFDGGINTQSSNVFNGLAQGNYTVTVISNNGCSHSETITVTEPTQLVFTASASAYSCDDNFSTVTVDNPSPTGTGPYLYSFNGGSFQSNNTYNVAFGAPDVNVIVKDDNGCTAAIAVAIPVEQEVTASITVHQNIDCNNGEEIIQIHPADGSGDYTITELTNGTVVADPTNIVLTAPGNYAYEVLDNITNCSVIVEHNIAPYKLISVAASLVADASCSDSSDGELQINISGYTGTFDYQVLDSLGNPVSGASGSYNATSNPFNYVIPQTLPAGMYTVRVTETQIPLCNEVSNSVTIDAPEEVIVVEVSNTPDNCNEDAIVVVQASGGTGPYTYAVVLDGSAIPGAFPEDETLHLDYSTAANWDIYAQDANGCISKVLDITITEDTSPDIALSIANECAEEGSYSINVSLDATNTGIAPYRVRIVGNAFQNSASFPYNFNNLSSGTYDIEVLDANGCGEIESITISSELDFNASVNTQPSCNTNDGVIDFVVAGGSGTYTTELFEADGITATGIAPVGNQFIGLAFGSYVVRVTDIMLGSPTNCTKEIMVTLEEPSAVTLQTTQKTDISCFGAADGSIKVSLVAPSAGVNDNPPYIFTIDNGVDAAITQSNGFFSGLNPGNYVITVTSNRNCVVTNNVTIVEPAQLAASISNVVEFACDVDNTTQSASFDIIADASTGTGPYFFSVDGGGYFEGTGAAKNQYTYVTAAAGTFTVDVKDSNGCTIVAPLTQTIDPLPEITDVSFMQLTEISCNNDEEIEITVTGGSGDFTFELLPIGSPYGTSISVTGNTAIYQLNRVGDYTFRVTDNVTECYFTSAPYTIVPNDLVDVVATAITPVTCFGDSDGVMEIHVTDYTGNYSYEVFHSDGTTTSITNTGVAPGVLSIAGLSAGNFYVELTATDAPFCPATSNIVTIGSPDAALDLVVTKNSNANCTIGAQVTVKASGGNGSYTYAFVQDGSTPNPSDYTASASAILDPATNLNWDVWVKDAKDCTYKIDVVIDVDPLPTVSLPAYADDQCTSTGNSYTFTATGTGKGPLKYSIGNGFQNNGTFTVSAPGTYMVTVSDANGCTVTDTIDIIAPLSATAVATTQPSCPVDDGVITITASGGSGTYEYDLLDDTNTSVIGGVSQASNVFAGLAPGDYKAVVYDVSGSGCDA
ncbi:hypothetical protein, partial [Arenibacter certesii]|uniref:hypothetical protein n=1 Tax=Arenibacter certesii TaxID=228955 RepID=UPI00047DCA32